MKKLLLICLFVPLFCGYLQAQSSQPTAPQLKSEGAMPTALKIAIAKAGSDHFAQLCRSGKVVYGSPINLYLETILDNLLVNEPNLRRELTLLVVKSPIVNAYANKDGFLLVNIGLLAQASNEAEIAMVLAHEVAHYALKHNYVDRPDNDDVATFLKKHAASREQESEADVKGIARFYAYSNYGYSAFDGAFDVMQYGDLPFDNLPFDRSLVENSCYHFPDNYFLINVKAISNREDYIDTLSTHPNIAKRRIAANAIASGKDDAGRQLFVQSETLFNEIRNLSRIECINQWLIQHKYVDAYYNAFVLSQLDPDNLFLQSSMAMALYGLSKHKSQGSFRDVVPKYTEFEGEQQTVYFLFDKMTKQEMNLLALRMLWTAKKAQPTNIPLSEMCDDIVKDILSFKLNLNEFSDYPMGVILDSIQDEPKVADNSVKDKYGRIKKTTTSKVKPTEKFKVMQYMLCDLKQDSSFFAYMQKIQNMSEDEAVLSLVKEESLLKMQPNSAFFIQPFYSYYLKNGDREDKKSAKGVLNTEKVLEQSAKRLKIAYNAVKTKDLAELTTDQYNDYCNLKDWIENVYRIKEDIVPCLTLDLSDLMPGSQYIVVSSTTIQRERAISYFTIQDIYLSAICYYVAPLNIAQIFLPRYSLTTTLSVVEIATGKVLFGTSDYSYKQQNVNAMQHAFIYDCLYTLKKGGKK
ncbi:MAG: M48 family metallopeptidase [Bacteroidales bacterium]|jgi:hypothetical protein|nr:M48 family metallopeptidase [Bacteroidales bacterium]